MLPSLRLLALLVFLCTIEASAADVTLRRVPSGGIEPQVQVDSKGTVHLIYFAGEDKAGDVFYCTSTDAGRTFSPAKRVNSTPASALIIGAVRGPQLAVDSTNRPHVVWTGNDKTQPKPRLHGVPLLYARLDSASDAFTPQRHIIPTGVGLDGGASIAADRDGNVDIVWHAPVKHDGDEQSRKLWFVRSADDFASRTELPMPKVGVCGCCALHAFYDPSNTRQVIFRSANEMVHRDMYLVSSAGAARTLSNWRIGKCVMSTAAASGNTIAFESQDRVQVVNLDNGKTASLGKKNPKHPRIAISAEHVLVAWTENTAWRKGGNIIWQLLDRDLKPLAGSTSTGKATDLPAWGYPAAFAAPGGFVIFY